MNPFDLSASDLLIWGVVLHLIADWPLQNDWMARNKALPWRWSVLGLLPAFTHAGIHAVALGLVFGYWPGVALGAVHLLIDTRVPVVWWSRFMRQTQPEGWWVRVRDPAATDPEIIDEFSLRHLYDIGLEVRFWTDQVFHIACIAVAALVIA